MTIAVVGASNDPEKYGYRIVRHLVRAGHDVLPVNLREHEIQGLPVYQKLSDIKKKIDIVDIVVPPAVGIAIVQEARTLNGVDLWIQPGAESDELLAYVDAHKKDFGRITHHACIMVDYERVYGSSM